MKRQTKARLRALYASDKKLADRIMLMALALFGMYVMVQVYETWKLTVEFRAVSEYRATCEPVENAYGVHLEC